MLAGLILVMPRALAVEEMRDFNDDGGKSGKAKSCPRGQRYSEKKRDCVKTSCGTGQIWSRGADACLDAKSAALSDDDLYLAGRDLGQEGHYAEALQLFFRIKNRDQARVLNSIGYSTRKLGDVDKGIDYYHRALALDPNFTKARQYLGEAYLQKGDVGKAKEQLDGNRRPLRRSLRRLRASGQGDRRPRHRREDRRLVVLTPHPFRHATCAELRSRKIAAGKPSPTRGERILRG